ncbi:MAG: ADP-ribosylglycohydrolase family protein [Candidatus Rifleibacteriota bacterium]
MPVIDITEEQKNRAKAALKTLFVGDALAMPAHWFYSVYDIEKTFAGGITQLTAAPATHPSSIMSLHSTQSGGRRLKSKKTQRKDIVGEVILKGKREFWGQLNQHYHQGMQAGENTLNAHCARVLMRCLIAHSGVYQAQGFLDDYIAFMMAYPPQHPDTYAESYHRGFFANLEKGLPPQKCAARTHDTASIGGLVTLAPLVFAGRLHGLSLPQVQENCQQHLFLTHPDNFLAKVAAIYVQLLDDLWQRAKNDSCTEIIAGAGKQSGIDLPSLLEKEHDDRKVIGKMFSPACYITDSWPSVLYLAYKYTQNSKQALLANTNLGADNVHRGMVLGAILGLIEDSSVEPWFTQLSEHNALSQEINQLIYSAA